MDACAVSSETVLYNLPAKTIPQLAWRQFGHKVARSHVSGSQFALERTHSSMTRGRCNRQGQVHLLKTWKRKMDIGALPRARLPLGPKEKDTRPESHVQILSRMAVQPEKQRRPHYRESCISCEQISLNTATAQGVPSADTGEHTVNLKLVVRTPTSAGDGSWMRSNNTEQVVATELNGRRNVGIGPLRSTLRDSNRQPHARRRKQARPLTSTGGCIRHTEGRWSSRPG